MKTIVLTPEEIEMIKELLFQKIRYFDELYQNEDDDDYSFRKQLMEEIKTCNKTLEKLGN